ncbi:MAG TPA: LamG domain-containing protein [Thermoanaerobaculia bacterium]|nr:LamG domain-containing protein [Thermoanaerobaculia bacterium]
MRIHLCPLPRWLVTAGLVLLGLALVWAPSARASLCPDPETVTFTAGTQDGFALPTEPAMPSAEMTAFLAGINRPLRNFDDASPNRHFAHTFKGLPTGICDAKLTLSLCAGPDNPTNDALHLDLGTGTNFAWGQFLSTITGQPWNNGDCATVMLDLEMLVAGFQGNTNILSALADGDLDIYIQDDTRVDYARLEIQRCPPVACLPPPPGMSAWFPLDETTGPIAHEITRHADGTHVNGPTPVAGQVAGALSFDGVDDHVSALDHPALNVGTGDFSVDFRIKTTQVSGVRSILEKRELAPAEKGWTVFLFNGQLALQLAEGGSGFCDSSTSDGCTNYFSGISVADGEWHCVAITVERGSATGIKWYVDGMPIGTPANPLLRAGSLNNNAPLLIASHFSNSNAFFAGELDEIELFQRVLTDGEVEDLCETPKCKSRVVQNWDIHICANLPSTQAQPMICNDSSEPKSYGVTFNGVPADPDCSVNGPTGFTLAEAQPILVPPGSCISLNLTIVRPPGLGVHQTACFEIHAEDLGTGQVATKKTSIWNTGDICGFPIGGTGSSIPIDSEIPVAFELENLGSTPRTVNWELLAMPDGAGVPRVRLDGQAAGESVLGQVTVPAGQSREVAADVALTDFLPFTQQDLLLVDRDTSAVLASSALTSFAPGCTADDTNLCLNGGRFRVNAVWRDFAGNTGQGQAVALTSDTGYFWFFSPENVELVLKVLDGRPINNQWWVFYGALSSVEYTITVTDTVTGATKSYTNPSGNLASVADTSALSGTEPSPASAVAAGAAVASETLSAARRPAAEPAPLTPRGGNCAAGPEVLCLQGGRFRVAVDWQIPSGASGAGQAVPLTDDSGYFWFFNAANVELVLKVLDGTPLNGHWWVFYGALSDVRYTITVTDTMTGASKTYVNPQGNLASVADTAALPE